MRRFALAALLTCVPALAGSALAAYPGTFGPATRRPTATTATSGLEPDGGAEAGELQDKQLGHGQTYVPVANARKANVTTAMTLIVMIPISFRTTARASST